MHPLAQESTPRHIHALVRLLKAPSDPPSAGGPSKIDFAYRAWSDRSFAAANKTEVLIEWILSSFARDGKRDDRVDHPSSLNPIAEPKYWSLLQETLSFASSASSVRPLKVWLLPLLYRVNLAGIVTELLTFSHAQNVRDDINLSAIYTPARAAIAILWPLAEKRVGMDALMECFAAVLDVCARRGAGVERATNGVVTQTYEADLTWICATVVGSYRDAFANFGNKKKTYTSFLATHLPVWVRSLAPPSVIHPQPVQDNPIRHIPKQLEDALYIAGTDTLFSLDALKQPLDIFLDAFARACTNHGLTILPRLFATRLTAVNRHRTSLFPSPSGSGPSALVMREAVRADAMATWESCWKSLLQGALMSEGDQSVQEQGQAGTGKVDAWVTLVGILDIIEKERLFVSNAMLGPTNVQNVADNDSQPALTAAREYALVIVERANEVDFDAACSESSFLMVSLAVSVLDVLVKIEYELVGGILGSVLGAVLRFPPALSTRTKDAVERLLSDVLDYHSKTRTVHTYALALLSALSSQPSDLPSLSQSRATSAHDSMSSPLRTHLSSLLRALRVALTPTQSIALGPAVLDELRRTWSMYTAEASKSTRRKKKQKVNDENALDTKDTVRQHLHRSFEEAFVQTALVAGSVLSNLSPSVYAADTQTVVWDDARKLGWEVVWACLRLGTWRELSPITTERGDENKKDKQKKRKRHQELDHVKKDGSFMSDHAVASAALRFLHDVRAGFARAMNSSMPTMLGESEVEELLSIAMDEGTASGLALEIIRTLFFHISETRDTQDSQASAVIRSSVHLLSRHLTSSSRWCGSSRTLTREAFGVALLHILVDRWMDVIDSRASEDVLQKFVSLLLSTCMVPPSTPVDILDNSQYSPRYLTPFGILCRVLHNAQFWELHNIQNAFLSNVLKSTVPLSSYTLHLCSGSSLSTMSTLLSDLDLARASEVYTLLMHVPPEYFTRSSRAELMKRAIGGDVGVCRVRDSGSRESVDNGKKPKKKKDKDDASHISHVESEIPVDHDTSIVRSCSVDWLRYLTMFRAFLRRMALSADVLDHNASRAYIEHLLDTPSNLSTDALMAVTLDLVILHLTALFRSQSPEAAASITGIVTRISDLKLFSPPSSQEPVKHILTSVVFHLIECLRDDFQRTSFASNILESLKMLYESLTPFLYRSDDVIPDGASALDLSSHAELRYHALSLAEWLGVDVNMTPIGVSLASVLMRNTPSCSSVKGTLIVETSSNILALLFEELRCFPGISWESYLEVIVALYTARTADQGLEVQQALDVQVAKAVRRLSAEVFSYLLVTVAEGIEGSGLQAGQCESLIHLSTILLHDAPQGTLKAVQSFMTRCLNAFTAQPCLYAGPSVVKAHYLELISKHCSDRPAAIRSVDLGSVWSLLCKVLTGSSDHDCVTSFPIFYHIVSIAGSLVRLRRDLVIHTLPHLAYVLHQLMMITRSMRPQLGAKQTKLVAETLPSWVSPSQPFGTAESRALSRLLSTLTIKTVPRTHMHSTTNGETQKAESLAKPFSKHTRYVLTAYVDALNDPLCVMPPEIRRELEPGLFSLCEMLGEHNRDALMVSALDSGGKTIMKALWKEYEKQRYTGKG